MKYFGLAIAVLIFLFWSTMNTLLVKRQLEVKQLGLYQQKVNLFLDNSRRRERWLGIYKHSDHRRRKLGYTGTIVEMRQGAEGREYHTKMESVINMELFGQGAMLLQGFLGKGNLKISGDLVQDAEMRPLNLTVELTFPNGRHILIQGERQLIPGELQVERFILKTHNEAFDIPPLSMPLDKLKLGNSLVPDLPFAGLKEGESFRVRTFDPVFFTPRTVEVNVVSLDTKQIDGLLVDVFTLETTFRGVKNTALVTRDGTVLRMKLGPPLDGIILRHESPDTVKKGFSK